MPHTVSVPLPGRFPAVGDVPRSFGAADPRQTPALPFRPSWNAGQKAPQGESAREPHGDGAAPASKEAFGIGGGVRVGATGLLLLVAVGGEQGWLFRG